MTTQHTPTPWHINPARPAQILFKGAPGFRSTFYRVADAHFTTQGLADTARLGEASANAAFICQAVNSHAALVEALEAVETFLERNGYDVEQSTRFQVRAALKLAKES